MVLVASPNTLDPVLNWDDEKTRRLRGSISITIKAFVVISEGKQTPGTCKGPGAAILGKPVEN